MFNNTAVRTSHFAYVDFLNQSFGLNINTAVQRFVTRCIGHILGSLFGYMYQSLCRAN